MTPAPARRGAEAFFKDWLDYAETPFRIVVPPRLYLIARDFEKRTKSTLDFLRENGLLAEVVPVSIYVDPRGRRIVDIESDHEPTVLQAVPDPARPKSSGLWVQSVFERSGTTNER